MELKKAQILTLQIAEGGNPFRSYKAPHAYRGTPAKPHYPRVGRKRLFKGHRP